MILLNPFTDSVQKYIQLGLNVILDSFSIETVVMYLLLFLIAVWAILVGYKLGYTDGQNASISSSQNFELARVFIDKLKK